MKGFSFHVDIDFHIKAGSLDAGMSKPFFDNGDVDTRLDKMEASSIPECMEEGTVF